MAENRILTLVYMFFVGVLVAIFVGVGVNTFYPPPVEPEYPVVLNTLSKEPTEQELTLQRKYDIARKAYEEKLKPYSRNVSIITLLVAVVLLVISLVFEHRIRLLADGLLLGGLFTLIYSLIRGFISQDTKYVFVIVTVGLATVLYLGYQRFVRPHEHPVLPAKS